MSRVTVPTLSQDSLSGGLTQSKFMLRAGLTRDSDSVKLATFTFFKLGNLKSRLP